SGSEGAWDGGYFFVGVGLTELPDDRVALPFIASRLPHKFPRFMRLGSVGLATWPRERITGLVADGEAGFYTPAMALKGDNLYLNLETRRAGYVQVEVAGKEGRSLTDCDLLKGDQFKAKVNWKGNASIGGGDSGPVRFHFRLRAARLYSFEVR